MSHLPLTNFGLLRLAWRIIGGWPVVLKSGHFQLAVLVWLICYPAWTEPEWWKDSIAVLPSLLGFTLGGFAIFLGFGSDSFKEMISSKDEENAQYLSVSAAFLMFVGIQTVGLIWAIACSAAWRPPPQWLLPLHPLLYNGRLVMWGIGYFLFIYGIALSFHAALRIFRLSRWYNSFLVHSSQLQNQADSANDEKTK